MKYYRADYLTGERKELTYNEALGIVLGTYRDNDMTRDMLTIPNRIECRHSVIETKSDDGMVLMAGLSNMIPMGNEYDDDGNRLQKGEQNEIQ